MGLPICGFPTICSIVEQGNDVVTVIVNALVLHDHRPIPPPRLPVGLAIEPHPLWALSILQDVAVVEKGRSGKTFDEALDGVALPWQHVRRNDPESRRANRFRNSRTEEHAARGKRCVRTSALSCRNGPPQRLDLAGTLTDDRRSHRAHFLQRRARHEGATRAREDWGKASFRAEKLKRAGFLF